MNFSKFYEKYIDNLSKFDTNLSELNKDVNYYNSNDFKVYSYYKQTFTDIEKEIPIPRDTYHNDTNINYIKNWSLIIAKLTIIYIFFSFIINLFCAHHFH